jgi:hypothetical protein
MEEYTAGLADWAIVFLAGIGMTIVWQRVLYPRIRETVMRKLGR